MSTFLYTKKKEICETDRSSNLISWYMYTNKIIKKDWMRILNNQFFSVVLDANKIQNIKHYKVGFKIQKNKTNLEELINQKVLQLS